MMRGAFVVACLLIACEQSRPTAPPPAVVLRPVDAAVPDAAPIDATVVDVSSPLVDLLHAAPSTLRVSSVAAGESPRAIANLVDGKPSTTWRFEESWGGSIKMHFASNALRITELRITLGSSGGRSGRTGVVQVSDGTIVQETFTLDPDEVGMQRFVFSKPLTGTPARFVELEIAVDRAHLTSPRSRKRVEIAELQVWGTAPARDIVTTAPRVMVDTSWLARPLCKALVPTPDPDYPECVISDDFLVEDAPWGPPAMLAHTTSRSAYHGHLYRETVESSVVLVSNGVPWVGPLVHTSDIDDPGDGTGNSEHTSPEVVIYADQVIPGGPNELVLNITDEGKAYVIACSVDHRCTERYPDALPDEKLVWKSY